LALGISATLAGAVSAKRPPPRLIRLELSSPVAYQVVQRNDRNLGDVPVRGKTDAAVTRITARAEPLPGMPGQATPWRVIARKRDLKDGAFDGRLTVAAGGWYQLQVRAYRRDVAVAQKTVRKVGVGEVFVVCGQSNSANYGKPPQHPKDDRVAAFIGTGWQHGDDPQPLATGKGGSPWPAMGDGLVKLLKVPVAYSSCGVGGTRADQWLPGGKLYPRLQRVLEALGPHGARAVLWHQSESDAAANTDSRVYRDRMEKIIKQSQKDAGYPIPWVVAGVSYLPFLTGEQMDRTREGQRMLWEDHLALRGPETDSLLTVYRHDTVHFNAEGLRLHGERWVRALQRLFFQDAGE